MDEIDKIDKLNEINKINKIDRMDEKDSFSVERKLGRPIFIVSVLLLLLECWKQWYLYHVYFGGGYDVWYLPFQLCSTPMYLGTFYGWLLRPENAGYGSLRKAILTYLQDFGLLGGIAALIVHDGFTHPDFPLLTLHGYVWHILMVLMALYIAVHHMAAQRIKTFPIVLPLFAIGCILAEILNVIFHPYGDCDMFYISPYHLSSQIVFHELDAVIGRPLGIIIYLMTVVLGAFLIHTGICLLQQGRGRLGRSALGSR